MAPTPKKSNKHHHLPQLICGVLLVISGVVLIFGAFFTPPAGEIHASVLVAFGEILTFVGALFGIDYHYKMRQ
ncbi:MAG: hypothetical protein K2L16_06975 [Muribaculaceae bacterium]|nr:hypothetical protein [Muribaculaceae bacterium]